MSRAARVILCSMASDFARSRRLSVVIAGLDPAIQKNV
jgi:hypothetical protein